MEITSKFWGTCKACKKKIAQGELIDWSKEHGSRHTKCAESLPAQPQPQKAPDSAYRKFEREYKATHGQPARHITSSINFFGLKTVTR